MGDKKEISNGISKDEAELYDRQIRLWGLDAQNRLRNASVLIIGLTGLGAEVAKTLLLCGIKSICLYDNGLVQEHERISNFFLDFENGLEKRRSEAVWKQLKELNPLVQLYIEKDSLPTSEEFLQQFDLVISIDQSVELNTQINNVCRALKINFQCGSVYGWIGYCFFDYNGKKFEIKKTKTKTTCSDVNEVNQCQDDTKEFVIDDDYEEKFVNYKSYEETFNFNVDWGNMTRRKKRLFPVDYFILKACIKNNVNGDVKEQIEGLKLKYKQILVENNAENDDSLKINNFSDEKMKFYCNPQYNGTCSIVGGVLGQQAISVLSQNKLNIETKNVFIYSSLSRKGSVHQMPM
uniref:ThiF domain-containing protein n=1 Tax=Parastrongyloides trichosuri TaxID=131310 RepID=A0A0N4ZS07_PARTI